MRRVIVAAVLLLARWVGASDPSGAPTPSPTPGPTPSSIFVQLYFVATGLTAATTGTQELAKIKKAIAGATGVTEAGVMNLAVTDTTYLYDEGAAQSRRQLGTTAAVAVSATLVSTTTPQSFSSSSFKTLMTLYSVPMTVVSVTEVAPTPAPTTASPTAAPPVVPVLTTGGIAAISAVGGALLLGAAGLACWFSGPELSRVRGKGKGSAKSEEDGSSSSDGGSTRSSHAKDESKDENDDSGHGHGHGHGHHEKGEGRDHRRGRGRGRGRPGEQGEDGDIESGGGKPDSEAGKEQVKEQEAACGGSNELGAAWACLVIDPSAIMMSLTGLGSGVDEKSGPAPGPAPASASENNGVGKKGEEEADYDDDDDNHTVASNRSGSSKYSSSSSSSSSSSKNSSSTANTDKGGKGKGKGKGKGRSKGKGKGGKSLAEQAKQVGWRSLIRAIFVTKSVRGGGGKKGGLIQMIKKALKKK